MPLEGIHMRHECVFMESCFHYFGTKGQIYLAMSFAFFFSPVASILLSEDILKEMAI